MANKEKYALQHKKISFYSEKYSRGRRGAPAKGVGRVYRRESSNLSFSAKQQALKNADKSSIYKGFCVF